MEKVTSATSERDGLLRRAVPSMCCQHTPTWTTEPLIQLGRTTKCLGHIPQLSKNKFTSMHMHSYLRVCVGKCRQMGANSRYNSYTLLSIPPFHSSSLKAHIFGSSSRLGGESYRVGNPGGFSLLIFRGNAAWHNYPLPFECQMQQLPWSHLPRGATVGSTGQR